MQLTLKNSKHSFIYTKLIPTLPLFSAVWSSNAWLWAQNHPVFNEYLAVFLKRLLNPVLVVELLLIFPTNKLGRRLKCKIRVFLRIFAAGSIMNWSVFGEYWLRFNVVWMLSPWLFMVKGNTWEITLKNIKVLRSGSMVDWTGSGRLGFYIILRLFRRFWISLRFFRRELQRKVDRFVYQLLMYL